MDGKLHSTQLHREFDVAFNAMRKTNVHVNPFRTKLI